MSSCGLSKDFKTKLQTTHLTSYKAFLKNKRGLELVFLLHFYMTFVEKYFSPYILLADQNSLSGCLYLL